MTLLWFLALAAILGCAVLLYRDVAGSPNHPAIRPLVLLVGLLGTLATAIVLTRTALLGADPGTRMALLAGYVFAALLWIAFAVEYTGYGPAMDRLLAAGLTALGAVTVLSSAITWLHEVGRADLGALGSASYLATFVLQVTVFALALLGVVLLVRSTVESADLPVHRGGVLAASGLAIAVLPFTVQLVPALSTELAMAVPFVLIGAVVGSVTALQRRNDLFAAVPLGGHLARDAVLEHLGDPVVVTDRRHRILDANRAAAATFDLQRSALRRRRLPEIADVDDDTDLAEPVAVQTTGGRREFAVSRTEIEGDDGDRIAMAYRFRDVTERRTREQQLQVLNRIARHTLRNDLDAIRGFAEPIRDGDVEPALAAEQFERIEGMATELVELSRDVERSGRFLADVDPEPVRCDVAGLLRSAVDDAAAVGDAVVDAHASEPAVSLEGPEDDLELRTDPEILRLIVDELLENAIEHSDREVPTVTAHVEPTDDGAAIEVRDDGPGIPEYEQGVLLAGEETPATHGSGLGLWLVHWAVTRLGGSLEFESNDPRGTVVRVHLPELEASARSSVRAH